MPLAAIFVQGLIDAHWDVGRELLVVRRGAGAGADPWRSAARELVALPAGIILAGDHAAARAAHEATGATIASRPGARRWSCWRRHGCTPRRRGWPSARCAAVSRRPGAFVRYAHAGGLLAREPSLPDALRRAAAVIDRLLRGARPADIAVQRPPRFELVVNARTAAALQLALPRGLLGSADHVIR